MSEFEERKYVPNELIRKCVFETDVNFTNGLDWQELLYKSSNEIEKYKGALNLIRDVEMEVMKSQKRLTQEISKDNIFGLKNTSECLASEIRKRYGLLQLEDILYNANVLQTEKCEAGSNSSLELKIETDREKSNKKLLDISYSDRHVKKSTTKLENIKKIMIAEPDSLQFRNFELKKSYKKTVLLKNVSLNLARFKLEVMQKNSKFSVFLEFMRSQKRAVAPGMSVKLIVVFQCDFLEETEENVVVTVQGGRPVVIPVYAFRDPPILQGVSTLHHSCFRSDSIITPSTNSLNTTFVESEIWTGDEEVLQIPNTESSTTTQTSEYETSSNQKISSTTYFECGKCFIGELVIIPTTMKNVGESGRFFIITEVDWSSMNIEDIANSNTVLTPPFAVYPAYFVLRANEEITFHSYFFPTTYGMQVDKFFIISDNCSVQSLEIVGDGIMYEEKFIRFNEKLRAKFECDTCEDEFAKHCVELDSKTSDEILVYSMIEILNNSGMVLHYRWEQRNVKAENKERKWEDLSLDDIIIYPRFGIFKPYSTSKFYIFAKTENLVSDQYRTIFQLCIEDIPLASIRKNINLRVQDSKVKRRMCQATMDIFVFDIEIRIEHFFFSSSGSSERIFDLDRGIQTSEDYLLFSPISEKRSSKNKNIILCSENQCSICTESMTSIKAIIELENRKSERTMQRDLSKTESRVALLKPDRHLYVGLKETFILILRNISSQIMIFEWGEVSGEDKSKLKISIDPMKGSICSSNIKVIQVSCEPLKSGIVSSFSVPCYSEKMENSITLKIECIIEHLSVSFIFSLSNTEVWLPSEELICIKWNTTSDKTKPEKEFLRYSDILPKKKEETYFCSEELELSESELDADSLEENTSNFSNELLYQNTSGALIPFQKRIFLTTKEPVIEFLKLSLKVAEKRIFLIRNETPLTFSFSISLRNFGPVETDRELSDENWDKIMQSDYGVVLITKPFSGEFSPFEIKTIEIYAYSDTWGDYKDEISINVTGLPSFQIRVKVQVEDVPVAYPVCRNLVRKTPVLKFMKYDLSSNSRTLAIENTSSIPIIIDWHSFLKEGDPFSKPMPFKIILDIFTPFLAFDFSEKTDCESDKNIEKILETSLAEYESNQSFKELDHFNSIILTPSGDSNKSSVDTDSARFFEIINEALEKTEKREMVQKNQCEMEVELSLIPDYGEPDNEIFEVHPRELFIPPKEKRSLTVKFHHQIPLKYSNKISCQVLGFIRISPKHKNQIKYFLRKDGHSLPPTVIDLEIINVRPYLSLLSSKSQKIFKCYANEFAKHLKDKVTIEKKLLLKNENQEALDIRFETSDPFYLNRILTYNEIKLGSSIRVQPGDSIEVAISCSVSTNRIQDEVKENERHNDWMKTVIRNLLIYYHDGRIQEIELCLQIYLPLLKLSTNFVNFGSVQVGSTTEHFLNIQNFAVWDQVFEIKRKNEKYAFSVFPTKGQLSSSKTNAGRSLKISIRFIPTEEKSLSETLKIITGIPGYEIKCELHGTGILDPAE